MQNSKQKAVIQSASSTGSGAWERGYFCAVAALLREHGIASMDVRELFRMGGDATKAEECDKELFRQMGMLPTVPDEQRP